MVEIESSRKDKRDQIFELNAEKKKITIKLDALRDFHAKRDIKVRQDLAKEQELRNNIEGDIKTFADREKFLNDQIEGKFKKRNFDRVFRKLTCYTDTKVRCVYPMIVINRTK